MQKLNKKVEYALMALKHFRDNGLSIQSAEKTDEIVMSAKQIAEATHAPYEVTARVLQVLSSNGILKSAYGTQGGYKLGKNLDQVSVLDLMNMIEGSTDVAKCLSDEKECDLSKTCTIISPVQNLNRKVQKFYSSISLNEVLHV